MFSFCVTQAPEICENLLFMNEKKNEKKGLCVFFFFFVICNLSDDDPASLLAHPDEFSVN